jgi:predicted nucleic acid-binding protein
MLDAAEWIGIPSVVLGELWTGFLLGTRSDRNVTELREFLASPVVQEITIDHDVARLYAEIVVALRKDGHPLPTNDIWVAAAAARTGSTVLTYDVHFSTIRRAGSIVLEKPGAP